MIDVVPGAEPPLNPTLGAGRQVKRGVGLHAGGHVNRVAEHVAAADAHLAQLMPTRTW